MQNKDYRKKHMRFSRFEDFVVEMLMNVENPKDAEFIRNAFARELERVKGKEKAVKVI